MVPELPTATSKPQFVDLASDRCEIGAHVIATLPHLAAAHGSVGEEAVGEPDGPELEAAADLGVSGLGQDELGTAAADVDDQMLPVVDGDRLQDSEMDQARFLGAADHLHIDARFVAARGE